MVNTPKFSKNDYDKESKILRDNIILKNIYYYSKIGEYVSKKRKNDKYTAGKSAVFAYLMELNNLKNHEMAEIAGVHISTFRGWKKGTNSPDKESLIRFCIKFNLSYLNSIEFLKAFEIYIKPDKFFSGTRVICNDDYYIAHFLSFYRFLKKEEIIEIKKVFQKILDFFFYKKTKEL